MKTTKTIIGIPSGDYENFCLDITYDEHVRLTGERPSKYDRSIEYVGLYRYYDTYLLKDPFKNDSLSLMRNDHKFIEVEETIQKESDESVTITIKARKTDVKGQSRYDGFENHEWFMEDCWDDEE